MDIVIPAKNEAARIESTVRGYVHHFPTAHLTVVITPGTDDTEEVVAGLQRQFPGRLDYFSIVPSGGNTKGQAVRAGWQRVLATGGDGPVGFVDADNSLAPAEYAKLLDRLTRGYDAVIASRYLPDSQLLDRDSSLRKLASSWYRWLVRLLFALPFQDTQCGGKVLTRQAVASVLPKLRIDDMTFDVELLYQLVRQRYRVAELPVVWREEKLSSISTSTTIFLKTSWLMLRSLCMLWLRTRRQEKI